MSDSQGRKWPWLSYAGRHVTGGQNLWSKGCPFEAGQIFENPDRRRSASMVTFMKTNFDVLTVGRRNSPPSKTFKARVSRNMHGYCSAVFF